MRVPRPSSEILIDQQTGKLSRAWFQYFERLGLVTSPFDEGLAQGRIWIGNSSAVPVATVISGDGTISASGVLSLAYTATFIEFAQDAIGAIVDASLVYVGATPLLTRAALTGAITASQGSNTTALGSFTKAQLNTAVSDGDVLFVGDITQYTDEDAQDAVGGILTDTSTIDFTYSGGSNTITADVKSDSITPAMVKASGTFTGTITTAALTALGAQGSMTFSNGILVSQVAAT